LGDCGAMIAEGGKATPDSMTCRSAVRKIATVAIAFMDSQPCSGSGQVISAYHLNTPPRPPATVSDVHRLYIAANIAKTTAAPSPNPTTKPIPSPAQYPLGLLLIRCIRSESEEGGPGLGLALDVVAHFVSRVSTRIASRRRGTPFHATARVDEHLADRGSSGEG
jgi:hypothetical protein